MNHRLLAMWIGALAVFGMAGCPPPMYDLWVDNDTDMDLFQVQAAKMTAPGWGNNRLDEPIPAGELADVANLSSGTYKFRAVFSDKSGPVEVTELNVPVTTQDVMWTLYQLEAGGQVYSDISFFKVGDPADIGPIYLDIE